VGLDGDLGGFVRYVLPGHDALCPGTWGDAFLLRVDGRRTRIAGEIFAVSEDEAARGQSPANCCRAARATLLQPVPQVDRKPTIRRTTGPFFCSSHAWSFFL
jgi:hypothetical protein